MVTKRYIKKKGKTFGPYYYESFRDEAGNVKKRYLKDYPSPQSDKIKITLIIIAVLAAVFILYVLLNQEFSHFGVTGRAIYQAKEIYAPGEKLQGNILLNLREGESIPTDTSFYISLGDKKEEFILSDVVDYEPLEGKIYAQNSKLSGEGTVFGIPGKKYLSVDFEIEIYTEHEEPTQEEETPPQQSPQETSIAEPPADEESTQDDEIPDEETPPSPLTGQTITEDMQTIAGTVSKDSPFTYNLEEGEKVRIKKVTVANQEISSDTLDLKIEDNLLTITTDYAVEGFGEEFLGEENAMIFKIDIADLDLEAVPGEISIEITYDDVTIASYKETILVSKEKMPLQVEQTDLKQIQEVPSLRIQKNENLVIELSDYFSGAKSYSAQIEDIDVSVEGSLMQLTPQEDFSGARKAKISATSQGITIESNEFLILVSSGAVNIKTEREQIRVGSPVKWTKTVIKENADEKISLEIPSSAQNVEIKTVNNGNEETVESISGPASLLTGNVVIEVNLDSKKKLSLSPPISKSFKIWMSNFRSKFSSKLKYPIITGKSIENSIHALDDTIDISLEEPAEQFVVEYETPAPTSTEESTSHGKLVTISSEIEGYTDIIAFTELDNSIPISKKENIKLYWHSYETLSEQEIKDATSISALEVPETEIVEEINTEDSNPILSTQPTQTLRPTPTFVKQPVLFDAYDLNGDNNIDYIEWVVPHLSNQTYEIVIEITGADHLDSDRQFISDIYESVSALDGVWSETIPQDHFVRVTFERNLSSNNDITIYPRIISGNPTIEIYEINRTQIISTFSSLTENEYNKVFLTLLEGSQDSFDLKISGGSVQFDQIIDPSDGAPEIEFDTLTPPAGTLNIDNIFVKLNTTDSSHHYSFIDFENDLILWIRTDDVNSSGHPTDLSSYSNNGTLIGGAVINSTSGIFGNGSYFDGSDDRMNISNILNDLDAQTGSISLWAKMDSSIVSDDLAHGLIEFGQSSSTSNSIGIRKYSSNEVGLRYRVQSTNVDAKGTLSGLTNWQHFVATWNSTSISFYHNGTLIQTTALALHIDDSLFDQASLGAEAQGAIDQMFLGNLDEILVFKRDLDLQEVRALYNSSSYNSQRNFTDLLDDSYSFRGYAVDILGQYNFTDIRTIDVSTGVLNPSYSSPTTESGSLEKSTNVLVNITVPGASLGTIKIDLFNSSHSLVDTYSSTSSPAYHNFSDFQDGIYFFNATINNSNNDLYTLPSRNVTIDSIKPLISFVNHQSLLNSSSIFLNISSSDNRGEHFTLVSKNSDVVFWLDMETNNGTSYLDNGPNSRHAAIQGNPVRNNSGRWGKYVQFDGTDDHLYLSSLNNGASYNSSDGFTISAWIKTSASDDPIVSDWQSSPTAFPAHFYGWRLAVSGGKAEYTLGKDADSESVTGTININTGNWVHVVLVDNGNNQNATIYINGTLDKSVSHGVLSADSTRQFRIGSYAQSIIPSEYLTGNIDEIIMFDRVLTVAEIRSLYNATANQYANNFTNVSLGSYQFIAYAGDKAGNKNQTSGTVQIANADVTLNFAQPTPNDELLTDSPNLTISMNATPIVASVDTFRYRLFNSALNMINETYTNSSNLTFYSLSPGQYTYNVWVNATGGLTDTSSDRTITIIKSCLSLSTCTEDSSCLIEEPCSLHSGLCSDNRCDFTIFITNATIYTFYDSGGNGKNLALNLTSNTQRAPLVFLNGSSIVFGGANGSSLGSGSAGGNAGVLNISVPDLFNSTNARFIGAGGYTTRPGSAGGNGGTLQINFRGLIRNMTTTSLPPYTFQPIVTGGDSVSGIYGSSGTVIYHKDFNTIPRDADINSDGRINILDGQLLITNYRQATGDQSYRADYDISGDELINVIDLSKVGNEWNTR